MFDLPMLTPENRRDYNKFRKALRVNGFIQFQESCYIRLVRNVSSFESDIAAIRKELPKEGTIHVIPMNMHVFKGMQCLLGKAYNMAMFADDVIFIGDEESA